MVVGFAPGHKFFLDSRSYAATEAHGGEGQEPETILELSFEDIRARIRVMAQPGIPLQVAQQGHRLAEPPVQNAEAATHGTNGASGEGQKEASRIEGSGGVQAASLVTATTSENQNSAKAKEGGQEDGQGDGKAKEGGQSGQKEAQESQSVATCGVMGTVDQQRLQEAKDSASDGQKAECHVKRRANEEGNNATVDNKGDGALAIGVKSDKAKGKEREVVGPIPTAVCNQDSGRVDEPMEGILEYVVEMEGIIWYDDAMQGVVWENDMVVD